MINGAPVKFFNSRNPVSSIPGKQALWDLIKHVLPSRPIEREHKYEVKTVDWPFLWSRLIAKYGIGDMADCFMLPGN
jgi:hypothetical protein